MRWTTLLLSLLVTNNFCHAQIEKMEVDEQAALDAGSLFEAFVANSSGWERGDVLVKFVRASDSADKPTKSGIFVVREITTFFRFAFDFPKQQFFYAYSGTDKRAVFGDPNATTDGVESMSKALNGFIVDGEDKYARYFPNHARKLNKKITMQELIDSFGMQDLRTVGGAPFGSKNSREKFVKAINRLSSGEGIIKIWDVRPTVQGIIFRITDSSNPSNVSDVEYHMDTELFVPLRKTISFVRDNRSTTTIWSKEDISWKVLNGIPVPTLITREYNGSDVVNEEVCAYTTYLDAELHWFSFNEELDQSLFDKDNLTDLDRFMKLLDPVATKAYSIDSEKEGFGFSKE